MSHPNEYLKSLLSQSEGLAIGEQHWTSAIPNFLKDQLGLFKESGVTTIYTELVSSGDNHLLQDYYADPTSENLEKLRSVMNKIVKSDEEVQLIKQAQLFGIRVVGIDQQPRPKKWDPQKKKMVDSPDGHVITNRFWVDRIREDRAVNPDGKYIVHGGNLHMIGFVFDFSPKDYNPQDTLPALLKIPFSTIRIDGLMRWMKKEQPLVGDEVIFTVPEDKRFGSFDITLCSEYGKSGTQEPIEPKAPERSRMSFSGLQKIFNPLYRNE